MWHPYLRAAWSANAPQPVPISSTRWPARSSSFRQMRSSLPSCAFSSESSAANSTRTSTRATIEEQREEIVAQIVVRADVLPAAPGYWRATAGPPCPAGAGRPTSSVALSPAGRHSGPRAARPTRDPANSSPRPSTPPPCRCRHRAWHAGRTARVHLDQGAQRRIPVAELPIPSGPAQLEAAARQSVERLQEIQLRGTGGPVTHVRSLPSSDAVAGSAWPAGMDRHPLQVEPQGLPVDRPDHLGGHPRVARERPTQGAARPGLPRQPQRRVEEGPFPARSCSCGLRADLPAG